MTTQPKFARLKSKLNTSGLAQSNPALYDVINELIQGLIQSQKENNETITTIISDDAAAIAALGVLINLIKDADLLTFSDESTDFPNSRELLAGTGITFDDTVANQRIINSSGIDRQWDVLTDGDVIETELIYANGQVIMTSIP